LQILLEIQFSAKAPEKNWGLAMWSSGMAAGGSGRNSSEGLAGQGPGWVEDGRGLTTGPVWGPSWGGGAPGGGVPRRRPVPDAGATAPAR
jgi:hypothetical protein